MKKFGYILAALATFVIAAPSFASAQTVVIKRGGGGFHNDRGRGRGGGFRGRGRGGGNKVVIIKKRSRY